MIIKALKLTKNLCIPHDFITVLTILISKPTQNFTVHWPETDSGFEQKYFIGPMCMTFVVLLENQR